MVNDKEKKESKEVEQEEITDAGKNETEMNDAAEPKAEEKKPEEPKAEEAKPEEPKAEEKKPEEPKTEQAEEDEEEKLSPRKIRKLERSTQRKSANPPMSAEERINRRTKIKAEKAEARKRTRLRYKEKRKKKSEQAAAPLVAAATAKPRNLIKKRKGVVVSGKADKTITVLIESRKPHPTYKKILRRTRKIHVHDERNEAKEGDTVNVIECRPMSRTKRWRLDEIIKRAR